MGRNLASLEGQHRDSNRIIVEFVGLPGAGKSLLANRTVEHLREKNYDAALPVNKIGNLNTIPRISSKLLFVGFTGIIRPWSSASLMHSAGTSHLITNTETRSVLFNWLFVRGIVDIYKKTNSLTILDLGLLQAYWSASLSEPEPICTVIRSKIVEIYKKNPVLVVDVQVPQEELAKRLAARSPNRSRIKIGDKGYSISDATSAYMKVQSLISDIEDRNPDAQVRQVSNIKSEDIDPNVETIAQDIINF